MTCIRARCISFRQQDGSWWKKLKQLNNYTLVKREQDYASRLKTIEVGGDVDLF